MKPPTVDAWLVPPRRQGQIVEHAFGVDDEGREWRRITDRSDGSIEFAFADDDDDATPWEPWNTEPARRWITPG